MSEEGFDFGIRTIANKVSGLFGARRQEKDVKPTQAVPVKRSQDLEQKETVTRPQNLGTLFQNRIASLPSENLPPIFEESMGASGLLATNEDLTDDVVQQAAQSENSPNGYIFGAGFGNILSMTMLYPKGQLPRAILTVDVLPEVVLTGRIFANMLREAGDFTDLNSGLRSKAVLKKVYDRVLVQEQNEDARGRLQRISFEQVRDEIAKVLSREYLPKEGIKQSAFGGKERVSVIAAVRDNFEVLQQLAKEGNIGVAYADITNPQALEVVKDMPDFGDLRNIVYMSNVIDHLTHRGTDLTYINDMDVLSSLGEGKNWFVDTTQKSQDYKLRAGHTVPKYKYQI